MNNLACRKVFLWDPHRRASADARDALGVHPALK